MNCYLCRSKTRLFLHKNGFDIVACPTCGLKATRLIQNYDRFLRSFYTEGYYTGGKSYGAYAHYLEDKPWISRNMKKYFSLVRKYKTGGKLLDVGCAMGFFLELAIREGFDAFGFDTSEYAVSMGKKTFNGRMRQSTIGDVRYAPKSFDVISMLDVVEHLHDPVSDLRRLSGFLKDDGIMLLATGNCDSVVAKLLRRRWTFYTPPQHLYFFTKKTFTAMLGKAGFVPIRWFSIGKWLSLRYVLHLARTNSESRIGNRLYHLLQKSPLGKLPLYLAMGDNMAVIVKKNR